MRVRRGLRASRWRGRKPRGGRSFDPRGISVEAHGRVDAAVELARDCVLAVRLAHDLGGIIFGLVLRPIAEKFEADVAVLAAGVIRDTVHCDEMILRRIDAALDEMHAVARAEPDIKQASVVRLVAKGADAEARD